MADEEDKYIQEELKLYISSLEEQLRNVQNECSLRFFQQGRFSMFSEQQQDRYLQNKKILAAKEFEVQQSKEKLNESLRQFKQGLYCKGYDYKERVKQGLESIAKISIAFSERVPKDKIVKDRELMLAEENFFTELSKRDAVNNEFFNNINPYLETEDLEQHASKFQDCMYDFSINKQRTLDSIWDLDESSKSDVEIERLQDYYHELDQEIKRALDKKRDEITELKRKQGSLTSELDKVLKQNAQLQMQKLPSSSPKFTQQNSGVNVECCSSSSQHQDADIDELNLINYELSVRLQVAEEENEKLKKQFWSAYRKIHQTADFKVYILEEVLRLR